MNINIKELEPFKNISQVNLQELETNIELVKYSLGQPICNPEVIPNKVLLILKGEARCLYKINNFNTTLSKIGKGSFIGLASILNTKGCEFISASSEIIAMSIPDKIILKLYVDDLYFKSWCEKTIQIAEACTMAAKIQNDSIENNINIKELVKLIFKNSIICTVENNTKVEIKKGYISLVGSSNIINKKLGEVIYKSQTLLIKGPFPGRIINIKKKSIKTTLTLHGKKITKRMYSI